MAFLTNNNLKIKNIKSVKIDDFNQIDLLKSEKYFMINSENIEFVLKSIKKIRQSSDINIYLKPIFIVKTTNNEIEEYIKDQVDGVYTFDEIKDKEYNQSLIDFINNNINNLKFIEKDTNISFKILRMIYTRNIEIIPKMNSNTIYGYSYPFLDSLFENNKDETIFEILEILEKKGILSRKFIDKIHSCKNCKSTFLNFKEVCTHCKSVDIEKDTIIHHFVCANMSFEKEYKKNNQLICPKCDKILNHIGVDYDKPSSMFNCNSCNHDFQEPNVLTTCFNCKNTYDVENINTFKVYKYKITPLASNAALFGFDNLFNTILEKNIDILPIVFFEKNMEFEINRIKRYEKSISTFILLNISGLEKVDFNKINVENIFIELSDIIRTFLRTTDMITILTDSLFGFLLLETDIKGSTIAFNRLKKEIETLFSENLKEEIEVLIYKEELNKNSDFKNIKNKIINYEFKEKVN